MSTVVVESESSSPGMVIRTPIHWWPVLGAGSLDPDVHPDVAEAYDEGMRCLSAHAPRAAAVMFRSALAYIVEDKASPVAKSKSNLHGKLKQMATDGDLHPSVADWADHIRVTGNDGAHPDRNPDVTYEKAEELAKLTRYMIQVTYEVDAQIRRARAATVATP